MKLVDVFKKDIKSNYIWFISAAIALVCLTTIITEGYPNFVDDFPKIVLYISVLAGILLGLGSVSLAVYILINSWYRDVKYHYYENFVDNKLYHYYRVLYAFVAVVSFILIALITVIVTTEATWKQVFDVVFTINGMTMITNGFLIGATFFYLIKYTLLYKFKMNIVSLVFFGLMIVSMLITLFCALNYTIESAVFMTSISVVMFVMANMFELIKFKFSKGWLIGEVVFIILALGCGAYFSFNYQNYVLTDESISSTSYENELSVEVLYSGITKYGYAQILDFVDQPSKIVIDGQYYIEISSAPDYYQITVAEAKTEQAVMIGIELNSAQIKNVYYDFTVLQESSDANQVYAQCGGSIKSNNLSINEVVDLVFDESCLSKEQVKEFKPMIKFTMDLFNEYVPADNFE